MGEHHGQVTTAMNTPAFKDLAKGMLKTANNGNVFNRIATSYRSGCVLNNGFEGQSMCS